MTHRTAIAWISALTTASLGCGPSPITADRIEQSVARTFGRLVSIQLERMGLQPIPASDLTVIASCRKVSPETGPNGAGAWECVLDWHGPNQKTLRDTYDVSVGTDGCYTATVGGTESQLGGPTVAAPDGTSRRNLLYAFDGCFDTTR